MLTGTFDAASLIEASGFQILDDQNAKEMLGKGVIFTAGNPGTVS
jgi:hypothetical protein